MLFPSRAVAAAPALAALLAGCAPESAAPTPDLDASPYWALTLDHRAVTLSTAPSYDTLRLTATPRTVTGEPLTGVGTPTYRSLDEAKVQVDADGLLHAVEVVTGIKVAATLTIGDITHSDTVVVNVTDAAPPPVLASLSIQPIPPDSAKYALGATFFGSLKVLSARAMDLDGNPIENIAVHYWSSDPTTATIDQGTGLIRPVRVGNVTFYATATAYGVTKADTLPFTIGLPVAVSVKVENRVLPNGSAGIVFAPATVVIGAGGIVSWLARTTEPMDVDVVFDDPTNVGQDDEVCAFGGMLGAPESFCGVGSITPWRWSETNSMAFLRVRRFAVPGTYRYRSELYGATGTIIVQ